MALVIIYSEKCNGVMMLLNAIKRLWEVSDAARQNLDALYANMHKYSNMLTSADKLYPNYNTDPYNSPEG